jgi:hypothetical protein
LLPQGVSCNRHCGKRAFAQTPLLMEFAFTTNVLAATPNGNDDDGGPTDHNTSGKPDADGAGCASSTFGPACYSDDNTEHSLPAGRQLSPLRSPAQADLGNPFQALPLRANCSGGRFQWLQPPVDRSKMIACPWNRICQKTTWEPSIERRA